MGSVQSFLSILSFVNTIIAGVIPIPNLISIHIVLWNTITLM
jgi:hypothetical protein